MKEKLKKFISNLKKYRLMFLSAVVSAVVFYGIAALLLQRAFVLNSIKGEINKAIASLNEAGYDAAYEHIGFSTFPFLPMVRIENFKIYSLRPGNYYEWSTPELTLDAGIFAPDHLSLSFDRYHEFRKNDKKYPAEFPVLDIDFHFDDKNGVTNITAEGIGLNIQGLFSVGGLKFAAQRMSPLQINELAPFFENHLDAQDIVIAEDIDIPLLKHIERLYLNANIIGVMNSSATYGESINNWLRLGGIIDIKKIIINWHPLVLVGRGDLYFNEQKEPVLHLNTSSKALLETMDKLQDVFLDRKGVFVAKILLNNKAFKLSKDDKYDTVTTPINVNSNQILIENIPVKTFQPQ